MSEKFFRNLILPGVFLLWLLPLAAKTQAVEKEIFSIPSIKKLHILSTDKVMFQQLPTRQLSCFLFLSPECPLSINYTSVIRQIEAQYKKSVNFYIIIPGKDYSLMLVKRFAAKYLADENVFRDKDLKVSALLKATITPEVVVLDNSDGQQVYRGAIDNWAVSLGKQRSKITEHYLADAIEGFINHKVIAANTKAVGCFINN